MRIDLTLELREAALLDQLAQTRRLALLMAERFFQLRLALERMDGPRDLMLEMVERIRQHADLVRSCIMKIAHVVFALRNAPRAAAHLLYRQQQAARIVQHCRLQTARCRARPRW